MVATAERDGNDRFRRLEVILNIRGDAKMVFWTVQPDIWDFLKLDPDADMF